MQVFVVSHRASEDDDWHLETVCSSEIKADSERDELFKAGAIFVRIEQLELDGATTDQIVVYIYGAMEEPIAVTKH